MILKRVDQIQTVKSMKSWHKTSLVTSKSTLFSGTWGVTTLLECLINIKGMIRLRVHLKPPDGSFELVAYHVLIDDKVDESLLTAM